jgi:hypothetical protein
MTEMPPRWTPISPGLRAATHVSGVGMVDLTFEEDGSFTAEARGESQRFPAEPDSERDL